MFTSRPSLTTVAVVAVAASALALSACSGSTPDPVQTVVVTEAPSADPSPLASAVTEATADAKDAFTEATADAKESLTEATADAKESLTEATADAKAEIETFTMPDLVGMNLQDAQDILQNLGSILLDQEDASGKDRFQVNDSNWHVCTQDPAPGTDASISDTITLGSVKLDEDC
jgi:vacuolar-type H+-ATPase subunit H